MWKAGYQPLKNKVIFGDYAREYSHNLSVSEQKHSQKSPYSWEVDRQIFTSPRYGEVDWQICLSYLRRADMPSPLLSLYSVNTTEGGQYLHGVKERLECSLIPWHLEGCCSLGLAHGVTSSLEVRDFRVHLQEPESEQVLLYVFETEFPLPPLHKWTSIFIISKSLLSILGTGTGYTGAI